MLCSALGTNVINQKGTIFGKFNEICAYVIILELLLGPKSSTLIYGRMEKVELKMKFIIIERKTKRLRMSNSRSEEHRGICPLEKCCVKEFLILCIWGQFILSNDKVMRDKVKVSGQVNMQLFRNQVITTNIKLKIDKLLVWSLLIFGSKT